MKILVDAFGGDHAPEEVIKGAVLAVNERQGFEVVLVGKQEVIENLLANEKYNKDRISVLNADEVITCEEEPTIAIRRKPNSSISLGFKTLKEQEDVKAFVSAGSTGAFLVGATLKLGRIQGVNRPAPCPVLPTLVGDKQVFLTDSGANPDSKPINICQFAIMGSVYAEAMGVKNPKVALLSNGTEDEKGNALNHEVFPLLKNMKTINFVGNIEARDILSGDYDVVVTDGFAGNVALKSIEGAVNGVLKLLKTSIYSSLRGKIGGLFLKKTFKALKDKLDYNKKGGAIFLGVNKTVIKTHGSAKREAIKATIFQAVDYADFNISDTIKERLEQENLEF